MIYTDTPRSRVDDPETSHLASERIKGSLARLQSLTLDCVRRHPGLTASEYGLYLGFPAHKRLPELEPHLIVKGERRKCNVTGYTAVTWWYV